MKRKKASRLKLWTADESSGLTPKEQDEKRERLVLCRLDRKDPLNKDSFYLSYFVRLGSTTDRRRAVLFCAGGPGEINGHTPLFKETPATYLSPNQYDVVAFDLRGAGFSQLPPSSEFDKYLRTDLAIYDIEAVRSDWLGKDSAGKAIPWDAIIARSYGSVLAQQYANRFPRMVKKLVLLAPLSRHMFKGSPNAYSAFIEAASRILGECLLNIYNSREEASLAEFGDLTEDQKLRIVDEIFGNSQTSSNRSVFRQIDEIFGNPQFIIDDYFRLKDTGLLRAYGLGKYSRRFYTALRELRLVGTVTTTNDQRDRKIQIGKVLRDSVLGKPEMESETSEKGSQLHYRVLYNMWVHDGLDPKFLQSLLANGGNIRNAAMAMGGKAHSEAKINRWLNKIQIDDQLKIKPWDPADYPHRIDTLILAGDADPVTCCNQAERWSSKALKGRRVLIKLPGVGHDMQMPEPISSEKEKARDDKDMPDSVLSGAIRVNALRIEPGEIRATTGTVKGLSLNEKLHFKIDAGDYKDRIKIMACGISLNETSAVSREMPDQIIMLIKNKGKTELTKGVLKEALLQIECAYFSGLVRIDSIDTISPDAIKPAFGTVVKGGRNQRHLCRLQIDEEDLDQLPTLLGFYIDKTSVSLSFVNNGTRMFNARTIRCSLSKGRITRQFRARIPDLKVGEAEDTEPVDLEEFRVQQDEVLKVVFPPALEDILLGEIPQEVSMDLVPVIIWVTDGAESPLTRRRFEIQIENPAVSITADVNLDEDIPIDGGVKTHAAIQKIKWKKWLDIEKPTKLESGIALIGYNILSKDKILMFFQNQGDKPLRSLSRDWTYCDPREQAATKSPTIPVQTSGPANSLEYRTPLLNRLIYSFLVRDSQEFGDKKQNKVLQQVIKAFGDEKDRFIVEYKNGDNDAP